MTTSDISASASARQPAPFAAIQIAVREQNAFFCPLQPTPSSLQDGYSHQFAHSSPLTSYPSA